MATVSKPKIKTKLLVGLMVFILIIVIFVVTANKINDNPQNSPTITYNNHNAPSLTIAQIYPDSVKAISWTYKDNQIDLFYEDGLWHAVDREFPLEQYYIENLIKILTDLKAVSTVENMTKEDCGLDNPSQTLTLLMTNDTTIDFFIGRATGEENNYYLSYNEYPVIYLVNQTLPEAFSYNLFDMMAAIEKPVISEYRYMRLSSNSHKLNLVFSANSENIYYSNEFKWFIQNDNGSFSAVDNEKSLSFLDYIAELPWVDCASYAATKEELQQFGLINPKVTVILAFTQIMQFGVADPDNPGNITYEDNLLPGEFELSIGNRVDGKDYARLDDANIVYLLDAAFTDKLLATNYRSLMTDDVLCMDWGTVNSMNISTGGITNTLRFIREDATDTNGNITRTISYTLQDHATSAEWVQTFLAKLNALESHGRANKDVPSAEADLVIVFKRNTDIFKEMTLRLIPYDEQYYVIEFNDIKELLVAREDVSLIKEVYDAVLTY